MYIYDKEYFFSSIAKTSEDTIVEIIQNKEEYYNIYWIPKKNGYREINAVKKNSKLYYTQACLNDFFSTIPTSNCAKGFVKGQSYFDFLKPHVDKRFFLRIDIKDFFGSLKDDMIFEALKCYCRHEDIVGYMVELTTINGKIPQGAITSPVLSNIIFTRVDQRILKYCQSLIDIYDEGERRLNDVIYTRYADDLLFSSDYLDFKENTYFLRVVKKILKENGFEINYPKIKYGKEQIALSGFVVGKDIHLSRKKMHEINNVLHYFDKRENVSSKKYRISNAKIKDIDLIKNLNELNIGQRNKRNIKFGNVEDLVNYLCGYRAFLISIERANCYFNDFTIQNRKKIKKIEELVDELARNYLI